MTIIKCDCCGAVIDMENNSYEIRLGRYNQPGTINVFEVCEKCINEINAELIRRLKIVQGENSK